MDKSVDENQLSEAHRNILEKKKYFIRLLIFFTSLCQLITLNLLK